ncbi:LysR family transcriptional regulator [Roseibium sediminicola]|uniref:LysR family transcriptional regulator n=1 Tax=Roseibium sediminicola TaxID=2933272 RepID=A0ABT0H3P5_9HYPH|nr:LysR family transcriptional regulator [Roseibium sp. CAU 1639]MCK7615927.1 LysR family transcriptional regulator [Roseibium sp. CAU 1639]
MNDIERSPIDSDLLRTFLAIANCGNLTVAAGRLNRTQSAISVQLRKLETGLGVTLFNRTPKGMALTVEGEKLLPKASSILAEIRQASALFTNPLSGSIRVGFPDDFDETVLERVLAGFARAHPGVDVRATSGCTSGYPAAIADGTLDIAVCSGPDNRQGETLGIEDTVWASRKDAQILGAEPVPLAILDRSCWWRDLPTKSLESIGREYSLAFRSSSFASLRAAIRAGFAIGILPASCVDEDTAILSGPEGFPDLPKSRRSFLIADDAPEDLTSAMAKAIRQSRNEQIAEATQTSATVG